MQSGTTLPVVNKSSRDREGAVTRKNHDRSLTVVVRMTCGAERRTTMYWGTI